MDKNNVIRLTDEEFDLLLLMLGYATFAARKDENLGLARSFMRVINAVNRDNPNFTPYAMPDEPGQDAP